MAEGFRIAEAYVEVDIDQRQLANQLAQVELKLSEIKDRAIKFGIDQDPLDMDIIAVRAKMDALQRRINLQPDLDEQAVNDGLTRLIAKINTTRTRLNIVPEAGDVRTRLAALAAQIRTMKGDIQIGFDPEGVAQQLGRLKAEFKAIGDEAIRIGINSESINLALFDIEAKLELLKRGVEVPIKLRDVEVKAEITELLGMLEAMQKEYHIKVDLQGLSKDMMALAATDAMVKRMQSHMDDFVKTTTLPKLTGGRWWWISWAHWILAGGSELAAVVVPAMIALGAAGAVVAQGAQMSYIHMTSLWKATEATGHYLGQTMGSALGLKTALQDAQDAANPKVYQAIGAAINFAKQNTEDLAGAGLQVVGIFDHFLAHMRYTMSSAGGLGGAGGGLHKLLEDMVPDLEILGQVFGNFGHAILNLAAAMPGLAGGMLLFLRAVSQVLLAISSLPPQLITVFMLLEETWRWGGLAATILTRLSKGFMELGVLGLPIVQRFLMIFSTVLKFIPMTLAGIMTRLGGTISGMSMFGKSAETAGKALGTWGLKMASVAEFAGGPWGMAIAGAALALVGFAFWIGRTKTATEQWAAAADVAVQKATSLQALGVIQNQLSVGLDKMAAAQAHLNEVRRTDPAGDVQSRLTGESLAMQAAQRDVGAAAEEHQKLVGAMKNVMFGAAQLSGQYRTSFIGALELATNAGVKLQNGILGQGKDATIARFQIADYVQGLRAMGAPLGAVGTDMNALAIQSGLATTKVQELNSAWDEFINNVTGGETALSGFVLAMQGLGQTGLKSTASMKGTVSSIDLVEKSSKKGKDAAKGLADSLSATGQKGAQTFQEFNAAITGPGQQLIDWFRTAGAEGQITSHDLSYAVRTIIAQMLPMAKGSKAATAELSAMAQEAGGPFTTNFSRLKHWVDEGGHSMSGLRRITENTTAKMANMDSVAQQLGTTMRQQIISTMNEAQLKASGLTDATQQLTNYINKNGTAGLKQSAVYKQVRDILTRLTGSQSEADSIIQAYTGHVDAGKSSLDKLHDIIKATKGMQDEYNSSVQKGNQPQKNMIQNLADIGHNAGIGTGKIADLIHKITGIPRKVIVKILEEGVGHFSINEKLSQAGQFAGGAFQAQQHKHPGGSAKGALIPGYGGGDIVHAMVEPGEAIVPKHLVHAVAPFLKAHGVPGFQGGGFIQSGSLGVDTGQAAVNYYHDFKNQLTQAMERAMTSAMRKSIRDAQASMMGGFMDTGARSHSAALAQAFARSVLGMYGWGPGQFPPLLALWNQESGWNPYAVNPSSGAYGIPQSLGHGHPFNLGDYKAQIDWGLAYIRQVYGSPSAAWAHEVSHNWYAHGTSGAAPGWGIVGEMGPELVGFHGGEPVVPFGMAAMMSLGGRVPGYARGTHHPNRSHMPQSGASVMRGFVNLHNMTGVVHAIHHLLNDIHKYYTGDARRRRDHLVHRQEHHLKNAVRELQHINSQISAGRAYRKDVLSNLSGYADLGGLMVGSGYVGAGGGLMSGGNFLEYQLKQKLGNLKKFATALKKLGAAHVPGTLIRQIVAMGPDAGLEFANEILAGGSHLIKQLGATEKEISAEEHTIAARAAGDIYAHGKTDLAGAFRRQRRQIEREIEHWAKVFGQEAGRWFNVPKGKRPRHYQTGGTIPVGSSGFVGEGGLEMAHSTPWGTVIEPMDGGGGGTTIVQQYYGTQYPTAEQRRRMNVDMALALGIAP